MTDTRQTALIVCPGRGVYNAGELGYFSRHHTDKKRLLDTFDQERTKLGQTPLRSLDEAERFSLSTFTRGDNASGLIYACSYADFLAIDRDRFDIVAVTGNSMGWYTTLACAGALSGENGFHVVNTMGKIMQDQMIGGQLIYPIVDADWQPIPGAQQKIENIVAQTDGLFVSIYLGGMMVLAGTESALKQAETQLEPAQERFPMRLANHAAFHTPLLRPNSEAGLNALPENLFQQPDTPMIDGRGQIWMPKSSDLFALWTYTFGHQVVETYDFTRAVQTGLKEFAPDCVIVLGPGNTLGGATAQAMLGLEWSGMRSKQDFVSRQESAPYLLAMGHERQRTKVT